MEKEVIEIDDDPSEVCPICESLVSCNLLQTHVETHFRPDNPIDTKESWRICHRCGNKVPDLEWEDHVYAHGLEGTKANPNQHSSETSLIDISNYHSSCKAGIVDDMSDEILAHALQEQEREEIKKEREKEHEEFKRLQSLYGMNSKSGYAKQYCQSTDRAVSRNKLSIADYHSRKENMLDALISGEDSGESCTQGVIEKIQKQFNDSGGCGGQIVILCSPTDHFSTSYGDKNWGCGYRNLQMLLSALIKIDSFKTVIFKVCKNVPSIPKIQQLIEDAWQAGYDEQGASQLGQKLKRTTKWIGATEVAVALRFIGLRAHIVDFHRPTAPDGTHTELFAWVKKYFNRDGQYIAPLYLQHQGHSRLVVGFEEKLHKNRNQWLLLFDPSHSRKQMQALLNREKGRTSDLTLLRKSPKQLRSQQYQVVYVDGIMEDTEQEESKVLTSVRIP